MLPVRLSCRWSPLVLVVLAGIVCACDRSSTSNGEVDPPTSHLDSLATASASAIDRGRPAKRVRSQTLYVPAYSHIYIRDAERSMNLTTTLSIRNTSPETSITLSTIDYYDSHGEPVHTYLDTARTLGPLASTYVVVETDDIRGGVGANFLIRWHSDTPISPPVVETVMIATESTQGISFRSPARVLHEDREGSPDTVRR